MVKITISNLNNLTLQSNENTKTVLSLLQENYIDWMHACGGKGRCTTCKIKVEEGLDNFNEPTDPEKKYEIQNKLDLKTERLSCQAVLEKGEVTVSAPEEYKLPHITYSK